MGEMRSYHGAGEQAIEWALHIYQGFEHQAFLKAWHEGDLGEWPEFYTWLDEHSLRPPSTDATVEDDVREMLAALVSARETLRLIAVNRQKYGAIATKCQSLGFKLTRAIELLAALQLRSPRADAAEARVAELVKPWENFHGDLPDYDHPLRCVYESGIQYAVELLAKMLEVEDYSICDGTEEFDGDLGGTLMNIVLAALPKDEHGDDMHPRDVAAAVAERDKLREALAALLKCVLDEGGYPRFSALLGEDFDAAVVDAQALASITDEKSAG